MTLMKKQLILASLLLSLIFLAGCIGSMKVIEKVSREGTSEVNLEIDFRPLRQIALSMNQTISPEEFDSQLANQICENISSSVNYPLLECKVENAILTAKWRRDKDDPNVTFIKEWGFPYITYYYSLKNPPSTSSPSTYGGSSMIKMEYIIEMPGEIYETSGEKRDNKAVFDLTTHSGEIYVKSRELNLPLVIGASVGVGVVAVLSFFLIRKKKGKVSKESEYEYLYEKYGKAM